ncbi:MAG: DUF6765 family protein [Sulfuricellaceae bacterium]
MNIDGHFCLTYAVLRAAGFTQSQAYLASTCAETVDINTFEITIPFVGGSSYGPKRTFLPTGACDEGMSQNWDPAVVYSSDKMFHFICPGAPVNGAPQTTTPVTDINLNPVNRTAWDLAFNSGLAALDIHTFGITLHMLADTFSHQQFYGLYWNGNAPANYKGLPFSDGDKADIDALWIAGLTDGHGVMLHLPDSPTLTYTFTRADGSGDVVVRDNNIEWQKAIKFLYAYARWYLKGCVPGQALEVIPQSVFDGFVNFYSENSAMFSQSAFSQPWFDTFINAIANGAFVDLDGNPIKDTLPAYNEIDIWWQCFQASSTSPCTTSEPTPAIYDGVIELYNNAPFEYAKFVNTDMAKFWFGVDKIFVWMVDYLSKIGDPMPLSNPSYVPVANPSLNSGT